MPLILENIQPSSGLTVASVQKHLEGRKFPAILETDDYEQIIEAAMRDLDLYAPQTQYAAFVTVDGQQDYRIFDVSDPVTLGCCAKALQIADVLWNPGGDWSSLNIFSPGWTMLAQMILFTGNYFHQPSQMLLLRQKLDAFRKQFGSEGWEIVGNVGLPDSFLRLFPVPRGENKVVVESRISNGLENITEGMKNRFYQWVEYYTSDTLANLYATTAGVDLLNFSDSKEAMRYWRDKAQRYYDRVISIQAGPGGCAMRG